MQIGLHLPNRGAHGSRDLIRDCARIADAMPIDELWVFDHIAIPPAQSQGSEGYYVEPLATLAFVAGITERVGIGTRVLILPYRRPYMIAKWAASIQHLSGGRLRLGCGVGWLEAEFKVLGVNRARRGALTDEALETIHRCFESDEVDVNGERVLFRPRPPKPPIFIGGAPPHALQRAVRYGDGWMAGGNEPDLRAPIAELHRLAKEAGRSTPEVSVAAALPLDDSSRAKDQLAELAALGVTRFSLNVPYTTAREFERLANTIVRAAGR